MKIAYKDSSNLLYDEDVEFDSGLDVINRILAVEGNSYSGF
jgi:hypothetical protein